MSEASSPVDPRIESLLRSSALWEEPDPAIAEEIFGVIDPRRPYARIVSWTLGAVAAAVIVVVLLFNIFQVEPDWTLDVVSGPELGAWGEMSGFNDAAGTRVVLQMHDLPTAQAGTFYEVWWVRSDGEAVSSGSFLASDTIEMFMGIRRSDFPKVLITLEQSDGNPAPSGTVVAWSAP